MTYARHISSPPALAVYNAGTDIYQGDQLGALAVWPEEVVARDLFVISELRARQIPTVMVLSGGYSPKSADLVAQAVAEIVRRFA